MNLSVFPLPINNHRLEYYNSLNITQILISFSNIDRNEWIQASKSRFKFIKLLDNINKKKIEDYCYQRILNINFNTHNNQINSVKEQIKDLEVKYQNTESHTDKLVIQEKLDKNKQLIDEIQSTYELNIEKYRHKSLVSAKATVNNIICGLHRELGDYDMFRKVISEMYIYN